jgi:hypothetical protein
MTEFTDWLQREIDERADGSPVAFARLINMSDTAVIAWRLGHSKPSRRGCKKLGRETGMHWRWIGNLAGSRYIGGEGNGLAEADDELEPIEEKTPEIKHDIDVFKFIYPKCDGCDRFKHRTRAYSNRQRYYCRPLVDLDLPPLCFSWSPFDVLQFWRVCYD